MYKWMLCFLFMLHTTICSAQMADTLQQPLPAPDFNDYLKKAKGQKTWAWITTSTGVLLLAGTAITAATAETYKASTNLVGTLVGAPPQQQKKTSYAAPLLIGSAAITTGIVLFSASGKNKRKAANGSVQRNLHPAFSVSQAGFAYVPTLGLYCRL